MPSRSAADGAPAAWWRPEDGAVRCLLCPHYCRIQPDRQGICGIRENREGRLVSLTYGGAAALNLDPVEKKPLFHFHPGRRILSLGSVGCNLRCRFCQNAPLVLKQVPLSPVTIPELVRAAKESRSVGLAYTYNEPLVNFEFVRDCASAFRAAGMANVLVTNGYINPDPLRELLPLVDAMNIDLKSMNPDFYRTLCGGTLEPVLETIRTSARACHVEVTNLLVTGENDSDEDIRRVVDFIASVDPRIPTHFSRYFPAHRFGAPPTPPERLEAALSIARCKLAFVYAGNCPLPGGEDTSCPKCGAVAVRRTGYRTNPAGLAGAACASCGTPLRFVI